ncbi:hypothetical protein COO60DRAFT_1697256 [Scenedesmus sp. NREL 46B-D3]|nr:hypothetical protein COO60DRAFT_1697256 [Scenedesmus sp. NREL 46B-D3]
MHLPVNYSRRLPHQQQKFLMSIKAIVGFACLLAGMDAALGMFTDTDGWAVSQALSAALGPYQKAAVFIDTSLAELHLPVRPDTPPAAAVIVVAGLGTPTRRRDAEPLLSFSPAVAAAVPEPVRAALLGALQQVELLRGVRLFPVRLDAMPQQQQSPATGHMPWAVFEVASGTLLLRQELLHPLSSSPAQASAVVVNACTAAMQHLVQQLKAVPVPNLPHLTSLLARSAAAGATLAFSLSVVPKWFCFVCPVMLGLLAPLLINAGVGEAADMACKTMQLPDDECVDLWFTALGLGMVLSLLSAIPIFKVCRLYECAHPNATAAAVA